jgi:hypothetical protein
MSIKIPSNQIKYNYTNGNEFIIVSNNLKYKGYYYEINNKFYAGKIFNINNSEIKKLNSSNINLLLNKFQTYVYGLISNNNIKFQQPIKSYQYDNISLFRYFTTKINIKPSTIKEIDKITFESLINDPLYKTVSLSYNGEFIENELNNAEKIIPGLRQYIKNSYS